MHDLLTAIAEEKVLQPANTKFLMEAMARTVTGPGRIPGLLPDGIPVAHKTGTIGGIANDVGYVSLPDGRIFAVAVFTKGSHSPPEDRDRAIAEATRALYDYYVLW